jgi:glutamyl-tRNA synthetase
MAKMLNNLYNISMNVRTRFAPSPTGFLHVGSARTALFAWLLARKHGGQFILRIEDTDKEREVEGAIGHIMESLRWLGIQWDEGPNVDGPFAPYIQSERLSLYREYATRLVASGFAYPDPYTPEEIDEFRRKAEEEKRPFLYRDHRPENIDTGDGSGIAAWDGVSPLRFKAPFIKRYTWHDLVRGELTAGEEAIDDFILLKADGYPTYNFCHVVDDIEMEITHVMRGEEFISSTPKFLSLYDALEQKPPQFATLPSILGADGHKKLSKRDGAKDILDYRAEGYLPEALVNFLALLGWNPGTDQELFSLAMLTDAFSVERVQKSGAMFNDEKLLFMNQQWMRQLSDEEYLAEGNKIGLLEAPDQERLTKAIPLLKERAHTYAEAQELLTTELSCLFLRPTLQLDLLLQKEPMAGFTRATLAELLAVVEDLPENSGLEESKLPLMVIGDANPKENGGRGAVLWPLRYALSGQERSPDPFSLIYILGKDEAVLRIQEALDILE